MSEPKLISPLLDNFIMGEPISDHNGIRCCPAMDTATNNKYIVKIISFPSSQTQLDALLLTKAFEDEASAGSYFESRANDLVKEVQFLQNISKQEGFIPYKGYQIVPKEDATGFDVYLLADYKRSLERHAGIRPFTHLDALNLGLDICSAFSACRRSGFLFVNLKPSNIYVTPNGEYKIGDLGFIPLNNLKYATMPENYISMYTAPEIKDPFASLNDTIDVYTLGAVLYQIYNGGELPDLTANELAVPQYADEEMAAIILKACSQSPEDRWSDPAQMGQMLVSYMQKNGASDSPIVPIVVEEPVPVSIPAEEPAAESDPIEAVEESPAADTVAVDEETIDEPQPVDIPLESPVDEPAEDDKTQEESAPITAVEVTPAAEIEETPDTCEEHVCDDPVEDEADTAVDLDEPVEANDDSFEATIIPVISMDEETTANLENKDTAYDDISDEVSMILAQADELAAMEVPEPVIAPEPAEITIPDTDRKPYASPSAEEVEKAQPADADIAEIKRLIDSDEQPDPSSSQDEYEYFYNEYPKKRRTGKFILIGLILLALLAGGFLFYKFYVVQTIDTLYVSGTQDQLTVTLETETDNTLLSIVCTDIYGTPVSVPVTDGQAHFSGLLPNTEYVITVNISGLHILEGDITANYFTPEKTSIVQHSVVTGNTNGSVILSFTVSGPDSEKWYFTYSAPNTADETVAFTGHTVNISGLDDDKVYTGTLTPENDLFIKDPVEITFTSSDVIQATDLIITSCMDGQLTAKWNAPENVEVSNWTVRCYNGSDYDHTVTTTDNYVTFTDLDHTDSFTVEVTANGQSVSQRTVIGKNTVTVTDFTATAQDGGKIAVNWKSLNVPATGWIISYTANGTPFTTTVAGDQNQLVINPAVPGVEYKFAIQAFDAESTVFEPCSVTTPAAKNFEGYMVTKDNLQFSLCLRPGSGSWDYKDVDEYTSTFAPGDLAGFVVHVNRMYGISYDDITTAFVILDENGKIVSIHSSTNAWTYMWYKNYCELNIPAIPVEPGNYQIQVYFNGQLANIQSFSVE